jgi:serine/threonine protein kinase
MDQEYQFLVYEYLEGGSLSGFLVDDQGRARLQSATRLSIMYQLARSVHFLHTGGCGGFHIFHRDIKSTNICLTQEYTAKLIDCGMAKFVQDKIDSSPTSVTPSMRKTSGAAVFGTPGYICPFYARGTVAYEAACDVYSIGIVLVELIVGRLQNGHEYGDYFFRYIKDIYDDPVVDGWKILMNDADGQVTWNDCSLERVCKIAVECIMASPRKRIETDNLVQGLSEAANLDFAEAVKLDFDLSNENGIECEHQEANLAQQPSIMPMIDRNSDKPCCLCNRSACATIGCSQNNAHWTCVQCIEEHISEQMGKSGSGICCAIEGCPGRIKDESLYGEISQNLYILYVQERGRQKPMDDSLKEIMETLQAHHRIVMSSFQDVKGGVQDIKGRVQRELGAMAYIASNDVKKCPSLVWMVPTKGSAPGNTAMDWKSWVKRSVKRKYLLYFICQHTFKVVKPPVEIEVARSWVIQVAPVLKLGLFLLETTAMTYGLPFPIPDLPPMKQLSVMKEFVDSFLDPAAKNLLDSYDDAITVNTGGTIPDTDISQFRSLTGRAYGMIAEKVNKPKRSQWKESMTPVINHDGRSLIWVQNEHLGHYE